MITKIKVFQKFNELKTKSDLTQLTTLFHVTTQMIVVKTFWTRLQKKDKTPCQLQKRRMICLNFGM